MNKITQQFLLPAAFCLILFTSCKKQISPENSSDSDAIATAYTDDVEADAAFNGVTNDVSGVSDDIAIAETDIGADTQAPDPLTARCYTVTISPLALGVFPKTVTIDFGTGCLGKDGKTRKGKIITVFTGRLKAPGSKATSTFDGYFVNDVHVEGTHVLQNNSTSDVKVITATVTNGKLTKTNGNYILWNAAHTSTQTKGLGTPNFYWDDEVSITGNATGENNRNGNINDWSRNIANPLLKKATCRWFSEGAINLTYNKLSAVLDYGNGGCDNKATITFNGVTKEITLP